MLNLDELEYVNKFAICSNEKCLQTYSYVIIDRLQTIAPSFCGECKYPLYIRCPHCFFPFLYEPKKYCGVCSEEMPWFALVYLVLGSRYFLDGKLDTTAPALRVFQEWDMKNTESLNEVDRMFLLFPSLLGHDDLKKALKEVLDQRKLSHLYHMDSVLYAYHLLQEKREGKKMKPFLKLVKEVDSEP